jgi:hypothetical protein
MRLLLGPLAVILAAAALAGTAGADAVYKTERLELQGLAGAQGGGAVVNIHADGPKVYAHEIYTLRGVVPGTYDVSLNLFLTSLDCTGSPTPVPTATIETNANGNGQADAVFTPEDADDLRGPTISINWSVTGPATYVTDCTIVVLD